MITPVQEEGKQGTDEKGIRVRVSDQRHEFMREIRDRGTGTTRTGDLARCGGGGTQVSSTQ